MTGEFGPTLSKVSRHWITEAFASPNPLLGQLYAQNRRTSRFYHTMVFSGS